MTEIDVNAAINFAILGGVGGLWYRLGAVLQGQTDNRRRMSKIEVILEDLGRRVAHLELKRKGIVL